MIGRLVAWCLDNRLIVVLAVLALAIVGGRGYARLPVDAVPDVTNVQVQVLTNAPGLSPIEIEQLVTRPIELSMTGLPGLETVRSVSRTGVSAVTLVFHDDASLESARGLVAQRLPAAREVIPASAHRPELGPLTTGLGEVFHFTVSWEGRSLRDVRTLFDWEIARSLRAVPGVVEVNAWGGDSRQIEVRLRSNDLQALHVTQSDVEAALLAGGQNAGGGALERGGEQVLVRLDGQFRSIEDVASQVVATRAGGIPVLVRDVATVSDGAAFRSSAATADGAGETVYGMVQMVAGGNAHDLMRKVDARLVEINARLPRGAVVAPFYDRAALVERVLGTVKRSLVEGGAVVVIVLLLFLGDLRAGLVVASTIPLAMLGAFALMSAFGMSGNLMSLGAIDFGLVVDGPVVVVEGALTSMALRQLGAREAVAREGAAVGGPIAFGVFIVGVVYVPVLLLEGVEGKMFRPMAWTVLFALGTALVLAFTWVPVATSMFIRHAHTGDSRVVALARRVYAPVLARSMDHPFVAATVAALLLAAGVAAGSRLGTEFVPRLEEGDLAIQITRPASVSLREAIEGTTAIEAALRKHPEVVRVVSRTGSPDVATDVMGIEQSDVLCMLAPRAKWRAGLTREKLVAELDAELHRALPGTAFGFTQPIEMRFQELLGGLKSDVGVKLYGDDLVTLTRLANELQHAMGSIPGASDVRAEQTSGLTIATVRPNPVKAARLGVRQDELRAAIESLRAGRPVGVLVEGDRRFDVVVRTDRPPTPEARDLAQHPIILADGRRVALGDVADVLVDEGPAQIGREQARRRVLIEANVRGRDLGSFVGDLERALQKVPLPPGYFTVLTGQHEHLQHAALRLAIVVPLTLAGIFVLLYLAFHDVTPALLIFLNVPISASGGVLALALRGLTLSISAAVGFIALFGVATLNGVVLLSAAQRFENEGAEPREAARLAADERLRPVLTTAVVASLGFFPMALATGTGAEVQRPLATVVIGGLVTATMLTLALLPTLYALVRRRPRGAR